MNPMFIRFFDKELKFAEGAFRDSQRIERENPIYENLQ
jgi:hypothetical protein